MEYTVEIAYPVSEGLVGGFLTAMNNFVAFLFLCVFFDKHLTENVHWMNYLIVIAALMAVPILLLSKESYARLELDDQSPTEERQESTSDQEEEEQVLVHEDELQNERDQLNVA